jgi:hypothetical protein
MAEAGRALQCAQAAAILQTAAHENGEQQLPGSCTLRCKFCSSSSQLLTHLCPQRSAAIELRQVVCGTAPRAACTEASQHGVSCHAILLLLLLLLLLVTGVLHMAC